MDDVTGRSLFDDEPFAQPRDVRESRLLEELTTAFERHFRDCALFGKICAAGGWRPENRPAELGDLPFVPAQYFKEAGEELASVPQTERYRTLSSSATSGRASTVVLDQETARRQGRAVVTSLSHFIGTGRRTMLVCDVRPGRQAAGELTARAAAMLGFMAFASKHEYLLRSDDGVTMKVDDAALAALHQAISEAGRPVTVIGFTFLLYTALLEPLERAGRRYPLPPGSTIVHIGGWKKLEDRKVDRARLAAAAEAVFGVAADHIVDTYGFTEQMGTVHPECSAGRKHAPAYADVLVRDPLSLRCLPDGEAGVGQFLSLVPSSYPGFSVLTDDIVKVLGRDICPCGRRGTTFEVVGRHKSAEIRGCGDVLAERIVLAPINLSLSVSASTTVASSKPQAVSYFSQGKSFRRFAGEERPPRVGDWDALERRLRLAQRELARLAVDDIIGLLTEASTLWARRDTEFAVFHPHGLSFIVTFIRGGGLQRMADASMRGSRRFLDEFRPDMLSGQRQRALPRGVVAHWLAGNVPTLGFLSLMLSLLAKNANILKVPQTVSALLPEMLQTLASVRYSSPSGHEVRGQVLTDAVEAVWYPHEAVDAARLSSLADVRIVWGGEEAVRAVANLPRRHDCTDIIFGPKLSIAAVGREALATEALARRAARGIAVDCSVFDQEACASAHTVFVEEGGALAPRDFAAMLADQMAKASLRLPGLGISGQVAGAVKSARILHFREGEVFAPRGLEWSVLFRDSEERPAPVYGRTALVRPIADLARLPAFVDRDTQAVGLALPGSRRVRLAEQLALSGVDRITEPGSMAEFTSPWDGVFALERLVRWVSVR
jgi:hypothetical protein